MLEGENHFKKTEKAQAGQEWQIEHSTVLSKVEKGRPHEFYF